MSVGCYRSSSRYGTSWRCSSTSSSGSSSGISVGVEGCSRSSTSWSAYSSSAYSSSGLLSMLDVMAASFACRYLERKQAGRAGDPQRKPVQVRLPAPADGQDQAWPLPVTSAFAGTRLHGVQVACFRGTARHHRGRDRRSTSGDATQCRDRADTAGWPWTVVVAAAGAAAACIVRAGPVLAGPWASGGQMRACGGGGLGAGPVRGGPARSLFRSPWRRWRACPPRWPGLCARASSTWPVSCSAPCWRFRWPWCWVRRSRAS